MKKKEPSLEKRALSPKEKIIEGTANLLAIIMLVGFFLKIVFF